MTPAIFFSCLLIAADSTAESNRSTADLETYQAARANAGRDPDANVRLALWCEAHGLDAERLKHLSLAALADPTHASARALLGMVSENGRWGRPESIAARIKADPNAVELRAEYELRRAKTGTNPDEYWKLARWCERVGLDAEATAHDTDVTRLDPSRDAAWIKLGCKKFEGRWMTPEQVDALKASREAQARSDKHWLPLLENWKDRLYRPGRQSEAEESLLGVTDPGAVRSIWKVFATSKPKDQARAIQLLGQVDSTEASQNLAFIAVFGRTQEVRRQAIETLRGRDVRGALDSVILLLRDPIKFTAKASDWGNNPGVIRVEGKDANYERIYPSATPTQNNLWNMNRFPQLLDQFVEQSNRRFNDDVRALAATNVTIESTNVNVLAALQGVTGKNFGADQNKWMAWWTDKKGYAFQAPEPGQTTPKPTFTQILAPYERPHNACFGAGTMVRTLDGSRRIEEIKVGDRLLTQDTTTGVLSYQPTLAIFHNPPANTLRLRIGGEEVVATGIHRFWKAGQGWVMARELKVGDPIRGLGGITRVESVEPDRKQLVFNLEVARGTDFFVGQSGVLVHDNNLVEAVAKPFDAVPVLARPAH